MRYQILALLALAVVVQISRAQTPDLSLKPENPASPVHPRRFGLPGGIGQTRGWYVWHKFDAKTGKAEVSHEESGEKYTVRVLPWLTTYRHLAYGAHPDELLAGERVNLFFNPDDKQKRAYLVHFQDELCQMKGHNHAWQIAKVNADGFDAKVMAGDKELDGKVASFKLDPKCKIWRGGKVVDRAQTKAGERVYLTWVYADKQRVVKLLSDAASLDAIQAEERKRIEARVKKNGMTAFVEEATPERTRVLVFATWWQQAAALKPGDMLRLQVEGSDVIHAKLVSRKNLGTYGSGCSELIVTGIDAKQLALVRGWTASKIVRVFGP